MSSNNSLATYWWGMDFLLLDALCKKVVFHLVVFCWWWLLFLIKTEFCAVSSLLLLFPYPGFGRDSYIFVIIFNCFLSYYHIYFYYSMIFIFSYNFYSFLFYYYYLLLFIPTLLYIFIIFYYVIITYYFYYFYLYFLLYCPHLNTHGLAFFQFSPPPHCGLEGVNKQPHGVQLSAGLNHNIPSPQCFLWTTYSRSKLQYTVHVAASVIHRPFNKSCMPTYCCGHLRLTSLWNKD